MDQMLDIAITSTRDQLTYQQDIWPWEKLAKRLSTTHRTAESYATYISSPKPRQDEIKDIGGFVGGYLIDGKRNKHSIKHRQILTLDIDSGYFDLWDDFIMYFHSAALVYSTHKHSAISPRLRLVLPLDRSVSPEEYEAIGRKIASIISIKAFDPTTFQAERLMYWPSTAKDGDYYFKEQKGEWLSADSILSEYRDWRNVAEWPLCPTESEVRKTSLKKQENPLAKDGVIGAFCRVYSISEAIETFIPGVYSEAGGDRFTFNGGTTAAGAVCYEDKFLYSHHSTDPISGMTCNAFDLIRMHKFNGDFGQMNNMARTDVKVIHELGVFKLEAKGETVADSGTDWLQLMQVDKKGNYQTTIDNFLLILRNDPKIKGKFSYNEFDNLIYREGKPIADSDEATLRNYCEKTYELYHAAKAKDAFEISCKDNGFHPVRDYLHSLSWDGTPRLNTVFIDQLGVVDTEYTRAVTRKSLTAAVTRVMHPGIKFDYMAVFIGEQGKGKSSLLYDLGKQWFSDTLDSVVGKDAYIQIQGAWLVEIAELSAVKKAEVEAVKKFLTKQKDRFRPPFGKHNIEVLRQTVFFGSTNEHTFLIDKTGNRRFWPLVVTKKYEPGSINPDQIWAEAVWRYEQGEKLYLTPELESMAAQQQSDHTEADERSGIIANFVEMLLPLDWEEKSSYERVSYVNGPADDKKGVTVRDKVCAAEIWVEAFKNSYSDMTPFNTKFIHTIMSNMEGWSRGGHLSYRKYGNQRSYVRDNGVTPEEYTDLEEVKDWLNS